MSILLVLGDRGCCRALRKRSLRHARCSILVMVGMFVDTLVQGQACTSRRLHCTAWPSRPSRGRQRGLSRRTLRKWLPIWLRIGQCFFCPAGFDVQSLEVHRTNSAVVTDDSSRTQSHRVQSLEVCQLSSLSTSEPFRRSRRSLLVRRPRGIGDRGYKWSHLEDPLE